jgi:predicted permease
MVNTNFIETLLQDARYSLRLLRKSPGFTVVAVLTLALGIGANAVVFSVMNAMILRPLNVPQPETLYMLERGNGKDGNQSYADYVDLHDRNRSFDGLVASNITQFGLDTGEGPVPAWTYEVSGNYFDALGLQPHLGRFFHASDEHGPNSAPYIVLTYAYWQNRFHSDPGVIGRTVQVNKHPFTVLGVSPAGFHGTLLFFNTDAFLPIVNHDQLTGTNELNARGNHWVFMVIGHLKQGVTPAQAVADLNSIGTDLERTYPKSDGQMTFTLARPSLYGDFLGPPVQAFLAALMLLSALILLAACANLGSLFAARAADRSREVALRLALGARRTHILRTLFTEAVLIALAGGALGMWCSVLLLRGLSVWHPIPKYPLNMPVTPDLSVYSVALLLALASGVLFSIVPVRQVLKVDPYQVVKSGRSGGAGRRITARDLLLVVQIAICAVLVTASMVAVRGLARSLHSNFGFDVQNTILAEADLTIAGYKGDQASLMQKRMADTVKSIAGVASVAWGDGVPLGDGGGDSNVFAETATDLKPANAAADAVMYKVSPEYFQASGTALLLGRAFDWHDDKDAPRVAVINRQFARKIFGTETGVLSKGYKMPDGKRIQIVGLVEDGKYGSLTEAPQPAMFLPILQWPSVQTLLIVRSNRDPLQLAGAVRNALRQLDSGMYVYIETRYKALDPMLFAPRMATISLGVMGVMGAMLAVTGIFGMAAYSVSKRLKELGIRMAIGARRGEMLRAALGRPAKLLALGSAAGLVLGMLAGRVLAAIVYQATPRDPLVLGGVVLAMLLLGLIATWIPARRAMSVDPLVLLREE